jgi:hypothetical protein
VRVGRRRGAIVERDQDAVPAVLLAHESLSGMVVVVARAESVPGNGSGRAPRAARVANM